MKIRYTTLNSVYEVEGSRVRRVEGDRPTPLRAFRADGEWTEVSSVTEILVAPGKTVLSFVWPNGDFVTTSLILSTQYLPEPFPIPEAVPNG